MACHLLKKGWRREEVDARLGHTPNSSALNAYINYLAIDREQPKKRLFDTNLEEIQNQLEEARSREKLIAERLRRQQEENERFKARFDEMQAEVRQVSRGLKEVRRQAV